MHQKKLKLLQQVFFALSVTFFSVSALFAEPLNLGILKKEVEAYHDSGLYEKEIACVINQARNYILQQVTINERHGSKKKLAIVLDIDETSLSNYKNLVKYQFSANKKQTFHDMLAADAPAIAPTLALYNAVHQRGVKVFFVTGRPVSILNATKTNLNHAGYHHWDGLYLRPDNYQQPSIIPFKAKTRELITRQGYTIVATIGDQLSDLKGGYAEKGFKLPNPYYYLP